MILLDTCVIIWNALDPHRLSKPAKKAIERANQADDIYFCDISLWEIAMLIKKGRLDPGTDYKTFVDLLFQANQFQLVGIDAEIAYASVNLPPAINQDPADRILAATSIIKKAPLVTGDKNLRDADGLEIIW